MGFFSRLFGRGGGTELEIAQRAWDAKDPKHCAQHLGQALIDDPRSADALRLVDALAGSADAADRYARLEVGPSADASVVALRSALLARAGQYRDAFPLLCDLLMRLPDRGFEDWLASWRAGLLGVDALIRFGILKSRLDQLTPESAGYAALLDALVQLSDGDEQLSFLSIVYTRKRDPAAAVARGRDLFAAMPRYHVAVAYYGSLRAVSDFGAALPIVREAVRLGGDELGPRLDLGDILLQLDREDEALAAYDEVLRREPEHEWALPAALLLRARRGDDVSVATLERLASSGNERATQALQSLEKGGLEAPGTATVAVVSQITEKLAAKPPPPRTDGKTNSVTVTLSALEPPSARRAAEAELQRFGIPIRLVVEVQKIPAPDPRRPIGAVDFVLWRYEGNEPVAAVDPPSAAVSSAIAALARQPWNADVWWDRAAALSQHPLAGLLAVMAHPPPAPRRVPTWHWWYRVQVAAALAIARLPDAPRAQKALFTLARGPHDWSGSAALLAIGEAACRGTIGGGDVMALFETLMTARPDVGDWCVGTSIANVLDQLEGAAR